RLPERVVQRGLPPVSPAAASDTSGKEPPFPAPSSHSKPCAFQLLFRKIPSDPSYGRSPLFISGNAPPAATRRRYQKKLIFRSIKMALHGKRPGRYRAATAGSQEIQRSIVFS